MVKFLSTHILAPVHFASWFLTDIFFLYSLGFGQIKIIVTLSVATRLLSWFVTFWFRTGSVLDLNKLHTVVAYFNYSLDTSELVS